MDLARGNNDFVLTLIKIFLDTIPADTRSMAGACKDKKWDSVSKLAHKLKSTIDTMQMTSLKEVIRTIEYDAKHGINITAIPALVQKVETVIEKNSPTIENRVWYKLRQPIYIYPKSAGSNTGLFFKRCR
jgi:HPt (histidine-containing phosphotransfer) domain-containing protein